jgi:transcriptional regulator with XRE-family HTH domain
MTTPGALLRVTLGEELRRTRQAQGRSLRDVAGEAQVSLGFLSEIERGQKEASSELLNAICGALDLPLSTLLMTLGEQLAGAPVLGTVRDISPAAAPEVAAA